MTSLRALDRRGVASAGLLLAMLSLLAFASVDGRGIQAAVGIAILTTVLVTAHRALLEWKRLGAIIIVTIFFVPLGRYELPAQLPIVLEPYRVVVAAVIALWVTALLTDPRVQVRRSGFERPIGAILVSVLLSDVVNFRRFESVSSHATKALMFFVSFLLVFYFTVAIGRRPQAIDVLIKTMVTCGGVVALFALIEFRTGYNIFDHLSVIPGLHFTGVAAAQVDPTGFARGGRLRVYASAQHPIALGAALTMLVPPALYVARKSRQLRWWLVAALCVMASCATVSRVGIVMLVVIVLVFLWLKPRETRRLWPLVVPLALVIHIGAPGTLGSLKDAFFPRGGLIAQEDSKSVGHGRLATLGPTLHSEVYPDPVFGEGYGTRVVTAEPGGPPPNAPITDDQWLATTAETGLFGTISWIWLFSRFIRRMGRAACAEPDTPDSWLFAALTASVAAFAVSMALYDAFGFIQVTFVLFFTLALGCAALRLREERFLSIASAPLANRPIGQLHG